MSLDVGHDFYCALKNVWVARSEFNTDMAFYHEPKNKTPYMAASWGDCPCIKCEATDAVKCQECDWPKKLLFEKQEWFLEQEFQRRFGYFDRCELCQAVCKINGKLR